MSIMSLDLNLQTHKEFRSYLRIIEGKRGSMLNSLINAAEKHLPALVKLNFQKANFCLYDEELTELLQISKIINYDENILAEQYGYISCQSLYLYIKYYADKHNISLSNISNPLSDIDETSIFNEGKKYEPNGIRYERDVRARQVCIDHYGCKCFVCGMDFEANYGELGHGFIEIHHIIPISERGGQYVVNPITDLRPLCSNCHSMIHRSKVVLTIEEMKQIINKK
jgi:predicted restriction endonuclease